MILTKKSIYKKLSKSSLQLIDVECDFKLSNKCRKKFTIEYKHALYSYCKNNNKILCKFCSMHLKRGKYVKYKKDNNFFKTIDSNEKAYLLGWIGSDGHINNEGFVINLKKDDYKTLEKIKNIICKDANVKFYKNKTCVLKICSKEISEDLCKIFKIKPGKKSNCVKFPEIDDKFIIHFLRGYFEGDGTITTLNSKIKYPVCAIYSDSTNMLNSIKLLVSKFNVNGYIYKNTITWSHKKAIEFLKLIYSNLNDNLFLERKYNLFLHWKNYKFDDRHLKVNLEIVNEIRLLSKNGMMQKDIAKIYNIHRTAVSRIVNNITWKIK